MHFLAVVTVVVLGLVTYAAQDQLTMEWYLWSLRSGDASERAVAAKALGKMNAVKTVPRVIEVLLRTVSEEKIEDSDWLNAQANVQDALRNIGNSALRGLLEMALSLRCGSQGAKACLSAAAHVTGPREGWGCTLCCHDSSHHSVVPLYGEPVPAGEPILMYLASLSRDTALPTEVCRLAALALQQLEAAATNGG